MAQKKYQYIIYQKAGGVATITLNRPEQRNAMSRGLMADVMDAFRQAEDDKEVRVIVLTGTGKAFCAGGDIAAMKDYTMATAIRDALHPNHNSVGMFSYLENIPKPIIARVNGYAYGGGNELAMACDLRIASKDARFGQPEIKIGLIPGAGGTQRLTRLVGKTKAMELDLLGDSIDADEAFRIGLVNKVAPADKLDEAVDEFVQKLLAKSPVALGMAKLAINKGLDMDLAGAVYFERLLFNMMFGSEDRAEGLKAFLEKRNPLFKGK